MRMGATARFLAVAALGVGAMIAAPSACLFPTYTFDLTSSASSGTGGSTSASGTASSSSSAASTGASTTGTGGAPPAMEDCLNGVDDNGDGKVDCEDPECQPDYECVDPPPTGWTANGYVALYEGASGQTQPDCPSDQPASAYTGNATLNASGAVCTPCGCGAPSGQDCQLTVDLNPSATGIQPMQVSNAGCLVGGTNLLTLTVPDPPWGGACFHDEMLPGGQLCAGLPCNTSISSSLPTVTGGACQPTGGVAGKATPTWGTSALACHGTQQGKGCPNQQVCQPKPKNPFKGHVCIEQQGDVACPSGSSFSNKNLYFSGFDDTRDCTGCNCGPASGGSCEITLSLYSDPTLGVCTTQVTSFKAGQCTALNGNPSIYGWSDQITKAPLGGMCQPITVSTAFGQVTEKGPTTFCCL